MDDDDDGKKRVLRSIQAANLRSLLCGTTVEGFSSFSSLRVGTSLVHRIDEEIEYAK